MKEISEFFQTEREKRGLTLESVSERSGISMSMLGFFEAGDFESIGAELIILNIIRGYCKVFEVDYEPYLREFSPELEKLKFQENGIRSYGQKMRLLRKKSRMIGFPLLLFVLASGAVIYGGAWISEKRARLYSPPSAERISSQEDLPPELRQKLAPPTGVEQARRGLSPQAANLQVRPRLAAPSSFSDTDLKETDKAIRDAEKNIKEAGKPRRVPDTVLAENVVAKSEVTPVEEPRHDPAANVKEPDLPDLPPAKVRLSNSMEVMAEDKPATPGEVGKRLKFAVEADAKTWVQVVIDDRETRSAMLYPGDKREWTAQKGIQVVVGNAGGVTMRWEDQPVKAAREPGRVLRFKLPEQIGMIGG